MIMKQQLRQNTTSNQSLACRIFLIVSNYNVKQRGCRDLLGGHSTSCSMQWEAEKFRRPTIYSDDQADLLF